MRNKVKHLIKPGAILEKAGLTIIKQTADGPSSYDQLYLVKMHCCGLERVQTRDNITRRFTRDLTHCENCRGNGKSNPLHGHAGGSKYPWVMESAPEPPLWPVPPWVAAMKGHWIWEDPKC